MYDTQIFGETRRQNENETIVEDVISFNEPDIKFARAAARRAMSEASNNDSYVYVVLFDAPILAHEISRGCPLQLAKYILT